jgi:hypothetical protein
MALEYISTFSNMFYLRADTNTEGPLQLADARRAPIESLQISVKRKQLYRTDKSGHRSRNAVLGPQRENIDLSINANVTGWSDRSEEPILAPLFASAVAAPGKPGTNLTVASVAGSNVTVMGSPSIWVGMALSFSDEIRFVRSVIDANTFELNGSFSAALQAGSVLLGCTSFAPGASVETFELFEFWSPSAAVQRAISSACANRTTFEINSDFVTMRIEGFAKTLTDSVTNSLSPLEFPALSSANPQSDSLISPIAGHLGQALFGAAGKRLCTIVQGRVSIDNGIQSRSDEFGCFGTKSFTLGRRSVELDLNLYQRNDEVSQELFAAAVRNEPVSIMLQLGSGQGNMLGIYMPSVLMPVPSFVDSESRVLWKFSGAQSVGSQDDEVFLALA